MAESGIRRQFTGARVLAVALAVAITTVLLGPERSDAADQVRIVGYMDSVSSSDRHRMLIDPDLNIGATIGNSGTNIILYDLERLERIPLDLIASEPPVSGLTADRAILDTRNHRIFFTPGNLTDLQYTGCASGPHPRFSVAVFSLLERVWSVVPMKCTPHGSNVGTSDQFKAQGVYYDGGSNRLYVAGTAQGEWFARQRGNAYTYDRAGISLLIRQVNPENGNVDWELDLRGTGCDRILNQVAGEDIGAFVARVNDHLYSYCYGVRTGLQGDQGFAVKIRLGPNGYERTSDGRPDVKLTPTLPNDLFPMLDPVSGNILLLTSAAPNGDAVWVFDPLTDRFVGVIASGISAVVNQSYTAAGLNLTTGRTYMLSNAGLLIADARHRPLPSGLNFNLDLKAQKSGPVIAVAPKLKRLFMPVLGYKYVVIEDNVAEPADPPKKEVDAGTANIAEEAGKTISSFAAASAGFGARFLNTGGISRAINNFDYGCFNDQLEQALKRQLGIPVLKDAQGRCIADQVFTGGTRDLFLGPSQIELGSQTGAVAYASGATFSTADTASDRDLKRISTCYSDIYEDRRGQPAPSGYASTCSSLPFTQDFAGGTRGPDGKGAPIPASTCADFGGSSASKTQPTTPAYAQLFGASSVECDADAKKAAATGIANGFAFPPTGQPLVSIARAWSTTTSRITDKGTVTTIESVSTGVNIGPYSIGRISLSATTRAHGRAGTSEVDFSAPVISTVSGPNINCVICDYRQVIDAMNRGFGLKMRVSHPAAERLASPLGYQSYVIKDPATRDSDRATNSDDTYIVPALQIIFYNDGHDGRNRFILQLAGVQAESRYGIVPLPEVGEGTFQVPTIGFDSNIEIPASTVVLGAQVKKESSPKSIVRRILGAPAQVVEEALRLIVHNPREFLVLFVLWTLFAAPVYLGLRRRSLLREVSA